MLCVRLSRRNLHQLDAIFDNRDVDNRCLARRDETAYLIVCKSRMMRTITRDEIRLGLGKVAAMKRGAAAKPTADPGCGPSFLTALCLPVSSSAP